MISKILGIQPGITAVIGSGGKTTLIRRLAEELTDSDRNDFSGNRKNRVIICTTTHILKPDDMPVFMADEEDIPGEEDIKQLAAFLEENARGPVCVGTPDPANPAKLVSFPIDVIRKAAGNDAYILVEADGARHMSLKAHNENEPVIPSKSNEVLIVIGAEGIGRPVCEAVHRPEIFAKLADVDEKSEVTPRMVSKVLLAERRRFGECRPRIVVNRSMYDLFQNGLLKTAELYYDKYLETDLSAARVIKQETGFETYAGCLREGIIKEIR